MLVRLTNFVIKLAIMCVLSSAALAFSFQEPLVNAADRGEYRVVKRLLEKGHPVDSRGLFGVTALSRASIRGYEDVVKLLVDAGALVDSADKGGATPLHFAAKNGNADIVSVLVKSGANINAMDNQGWTPLMRAIAEKNNKAVEVLIGAGADISLVNNINDSALILSARLGAPELLIDFLGSDSFNKVPNEQKQEALAIANNQEDKSFYNILKKTIGGVQKKSGNEQENQTEIAAVDIKQEEKKQIEFEKIMDSSDVAEEEKSKEVSKKIAEPVIEKKDTPVFVEPKEEVKKEIKAELKPKENPSSPKKVLEKKEEKDFVSMIDEWFSDDDATDVAVNEEKKESEEVEVSSSGSDIKSYLDQFYEENERLDEGDYSAIKEESPKIEVAEEKKQREGVSFDDIPTTNQSAKLTRESPVLDRGQESSFKELLDSVEDRDNLKMPADIAVADDDYDIFLEPLEPDLDMLGHYPIEDDEYYITEIEGLPWNDGEKEEVKSKTVKISEPKPIKANYEERGKFLLQLGTFDNRLLAIDEWKRLQKSNQDVLSSLKPNILKAHLAVDESSVFRLRAAEIGNKVEAEKMCKILRDRNIQCFVVESEPEAMPDIRNAKKIQDDGPIDIASLTPPSKASINLKPNEQQSFGSPYKAQDPNITDKEYSGSLSSPYESGVRQMVQNNQARQPRYYRYLDRESNPMTLQPPSYEQARKEREIARNNMIPPPYVGEVMPEEAFAGSAPVTNSKDMASLEVPKAPIVLNQEKPKEIPVYQDPVKEMQGQKPYLSGPMGHNRAYEQNQMPVPYMVDPGMAEATRISPEQYQSIVPQQNMIAKPSNYMDLAGGIWVNIGNFPNEMLANDYWLRMFKYNESYQHLQMMLVKTGTEAGFPMVSIRVGPLASSMQSKDVCNIVMNTGLNCMAIGGEKPKTQMAKQQPKQESYDKSQIKEKLPEEPINKYWLHLGTFAEEQEAEYYWMFIGEDNPDLFSGLKYDIVPMEESVEPDQAVRLRAGPFSMANRAIERCNSFKTRNIACLVTK